MVASTSDEVVVADAYDPNPELAAPEPPSDFAAAAAGGTARALIHPRFPARWYWLADDGRLYSAETKGVVPEDDAGYAEFLAQGERPTRWPHDDAGVQTDAALWAVLGPYGLGPKRIFTWPEFMDLFTEPEQATIAAAAMQSVPIKLWYDRACGAGTLDLDSGRVVAGIGVLVGAGLLSEERAEAVLAGTLPS
jgi:hypothetical protein